MIVAAKVKNYGKINLANTFGGHQVHLSPQTLKTRNEENTDSSNKFDPVAEMM